MEDRGTRELSPDEEEILEFMRTHDRPGFSPTLIGKAVGGKSTLKAASWACYRLKKLVDAGLVRRHGWGWYKLVKVKK